LATVLTDGDPANEPKAMDYLGRAGLGDRIRWHVGDAVTSFDKIACQPILIGKAVFR